MSDWLSRKEAAIFLNKIGCPVSPQTLATMAANNNAGAGPPYTRYRWKNVRYLKADLIAWANKEMVRIK